MERSAAAVSAAEGAVLSAQQRFNAARTKATEAQEDLKREETLLAAGPPSQVSRQLADTDLLTRAQRLLTILQSAAASRDWPDEVIATMTDLQQ